MQVKCISLRTVKKDGFKRHISIVVRNGFTSKKNLAFMGVKGKGKGGILGN